jgi:hypothetical protein
MRNVNTQFLMRGNIHNIQLTSSELACIWNAYVENSMLICVLSYFLEKVEDTEVQPILKFAKEISAK